MATNAPAPPSEAMVEMSGNNPMADLGNLSDPELAAAPVFRPESEGQDEDGEGKTVGKIARCNAAIQKVLMTPLIPDGPWKLPSAIAFGEHREIPR